MIYVLNLNVLFNTILDIYCRSFQQPDPQRMSIISSIYFTSYIACWLFLSSRQIEKVLKELKIDLCKKWYSLVLVNHSLCSPYKGDGMTTHYVASEQVFTNTLNF